MPSPDQLVWDYLCQSVENMQFLRIDLLWWIRR